MLTTTHSLTKEAVTKVGSEVSEKFIPIKERPRIKKLLDGVMGAKYATLGFLANVIAIEVYKELVAYGLYAQEENTEFVQVLDSIFDLFRELKVHNAREGRVVVNHLGVLLGVKLLADSRLHDLKERRKLVVDRLQLDYMQAGLAEPLDPMDMSPADFFDRQLNRFQQIRGVDTNSYYVLVRSLARIQKENKDDPYVVSWCAATLRQLEEFEKSLRASWLPFAGVKVNKRLSALNRDKAAIYKLEKTKIEKTKK